MKKDVEALERQVEDDKRALERHPIYERVRDLPTLRRFMEAHVFAVWDFMSLLKSLQRRLTCVRVPWTPPEDARAARFVNEIVLAEESDEIAPGRFLSHLELYLEAMREVGADPGPFLETMRRLASASDARRQLAAEPLLPEVRGFLGTSLELADGELPETAAAFCHGREDLIPRMFERLVAVVDRHALPCPAFRLYLERHCALDGDHHGPMSRALMASLCGDDPEKLALAHDAARRALAARHALWTGLARHLLVEESTAGG